MAPGEKRKREKQRHCLVVVVACGLFESGHRVFLQHRLSIGAEEEWASRHLLLHVDEEQHDGDTVGGGEGEDDGEHDEGLQNPVPGQRASFLVYEVYEAWNQRLQQKEKEAKKNLNPREESLMASDTESENEVGTWGKKVELGIREVLDSEIKRVKMGQADPHSHYRTD